MATATWGRSLADDTVATVPPCRAGDDAFPEQPSRPPTRPIARDKADGRIGEIMPDAVPAHLCAPGVPRKVNLRPVGGGVEWTVEPGNVEYLPPLGGQS